MLTMTRDENLAAVLHGVGDLRVEELPVPEPGPGDVLVGIRSVGIRGSDIRFFATPPIDGSLARYVTHPADFCFRLPEHVSLDEGALLEPLSVGLHGCRRGGVGPGSRVLVQGAGPVGLTALLMARASGAIKVIVEISL